MTVLLQSERWLRMEANRMNSERARQEEVLDAVRKAHAREMYEALKECAARCRYDGDLFDNQCLISRRDASWHASDRAYAVLAKIEAEAE